MQISLWSANSTALHCMGCGLL